MFWDLVLKLMEPTIRYKKSFDFESGIYKQSSVLDHVVIVIIFLICNIQPLFKLI